MIRPDGTGFRRLTKDPRDSSPAWSPLGRWLAFERAGAIFIVGADGRGLTRLTRKGVDAHDPTWSPDGRSIAFVSDGSLVVMGSSGRRPRVLLRSGEGSFVQGPSWAPDGSSIAFAQTEEYGGGHLYGSIAVIRTTGGAVRYLTNGSAIIPDGAPPGSWAEDADPDWSPDGSRVAFTRNVWLCGSCDQEEIFSVSVDGSDLRWATTDPSIARGGARPSWAPDGTSLVAERGGIAILTLDGTTVRVLDPRGSDPAWQPRRRP